MPVYFHRACSGQISLAILALKEDSAGYFWSCIFVFFIALLNMWNNINHWHKNTQLELFLTLLSCNYNTTISIKTNRSKTWTLPMMSPALTSWKIDYAETTKLGGWLVFSLTLNYLWSCWLISSSPTALTKLLVLLTSNFKCKIIKMTII